MRKKIPGQVLALVFGILLWTWPFLLFRKMKKIKFKVNNFQIDKENHILRKLKTGRGEEVAKKYPQNNYRSPKEIVEFEKIVVKFRKEKPEKVKEIEDEIKKEHKYFNENTLKKHVDNEIAWPPILLVKPIKPPKGGKTVYLSDLQDSGKEIENYTGKETEMDKNCMFEKIETSAIYPDHLVEKLNEIISIMPEEDQDMFKMRFGLNPYEKEHTLKEIAEKYKTTPKTIFYRLKSHFEVISEIMRGFG